MALSMNIPNRLRESVSSLIESREVFGVSPKMIRKANRLSLWLTFGPVQSWWPAILPSEMSEGRLMASRLLKSSMFIYYDPEDIAADQLQPILLLAATGPLYSIGIRATDFALSLNGLALYASLFFAEALPRTGIAGLLDLQVSRDRLEAESDQPHAPIWRRIAQLVGECDRLSSFGDLKSAALAFDRPPPSVASIAPELCLKFEGILRAELDKHRNAAEIRD